LITVIAVAVNITSKLPDLGITVTVTGISFFSVSRTALESRRHNKAGIMPSNTGGLS
jgi:hypothetical protein